MAQVLQFRRLMHFDISRLFRGWTLFLVAAAFVAGCSSSSTHEDEVVFANNTTLGRSLVLENEKVRLSILPDLGGRIYEFYWKETGHEQLYQNPAWKTVQGWGVNGCRKGYWKTIGGTEFSFPYQEHGCIYDQKFTAENMVLSGAQGVRLTFGPDDTKTLGMKFTVEITLPDHSAAFDIHTIIENVTSKTLSYQYWINAMMTPGGLDPRDAGLEFVYPASTHQMIYHGGGGKGELLPDTSHEGAINPWPTQMTLYDFFKDRWVVGWFASTLVDWQAAYSHVRNEGVLRIYKTPQGGKFFALGPTPQSLFTGTGTTQYLEMWSGLTRDFWQDTTIAPGAVVELTERWVPFQLSSPGSDVVTPLSNIVQTHHF